MSNIKLDSSSLVIGPLSEAAANGWNSFVGQSLFQVLHPRILFFSFHLVLS